MGKKCSLFEITVVITTYNTGKKLSICLEELSRQTFKNFNILIIDDASTDETPNIIENWRLAFRDRYHTIYCKKNNGYPGVCRNIALNSSWLLGNYVLFLDGDDNIESHMLETLYKYALSEKADILCCGYNRINAKTKKEQSKEMTEFYVKQITADKNREYIPFINGSLWNKLIRKECLVNVKFSSFRVGEDACFLLNLYKTTKKIMFISDILIHYNVNEKSLMSSICDVEIKRFAEELVHIYKSSDKQYKPIVILSAFIHIGISMAIRAYQGHEIDIEKFIAWVRTYMNENFPQWEKSMCFNCQMLLKTGLRGVAIKLCVYLYKWNLFSAFVKTYDFLTRIFGKDIKW